MFEAPTSKTPEKKIDSKYSGLTFKRLPGKRHLLEGLVDGKKIKIEIDQSINVGTKYKIIEALADGNALTPEETQEIYSGYFEEVYRNNN